MRAFVITGPGRGGVREVAPPEARDRRGGRRRRTGSACAARTSSSSPARWPTCTPASAAYPLRIGHEWCGAVTAVGDGVDAALARAARHGRHDARLRPLRPLPRRAGSTCAPTASRSASAAAGRARWPSSWRCPPRRCIDAARRGRRRGRGAGRARRERVARRAAARARARRAAARRSAPARSGCSSRCSRRPEGCRGPPRGAARAGRGVRPLARLLRTSGRPDGLPSSPRTPSSTPPTRRRCPRSPSTSSSPAGAWSASASRATPSLVDTPPRHPQGRDRRRHPQRSPGLAGAIDLYASGRIDPTPLVAGVVGLGRRRGRARGRPPGRLGGCPEGPRGPPALTRNGAPRHPDVATGSRRTRWITHRWRSHGRATDAQWPGTRDTGARDGEGEDGAGRG